MGNTTEEDNRTTTHSEIPARGPGRLISAWLVHAFTASGVVFSLLAIEAIYSGNDRIALVWMFVAVAIDSLDGTLARFAKVKTVLPGFDGALLDNLIDFANYVIVPALLIHKADLLPAEWSFTVVSLICVASSYQFCQAEAKTDDHFFTGFPCYWNVVALYLLALKLPLHLNLCVLIGLVIMIFVPIRYLYINRTRPLRPLTMTLTLSWSVSVVFILWQLPDPAGWLVWSSLTFFVYYLLVSLYLNRRRPTA